MKLLERLLQELLGAFKACFKGSRLILHISAIALTLLIVLSGLDWKYYLASRNVPMQFIYPALILGSILPFLMPLAFFALGYLKKNRFQISIAYALGEAALLGSAISSLYKALTGRMPPPFGYNTLTDLSHGFNFGFFKGGIFWGWPSSHTTIAFSMAVALFTLLPKHRAYTVPFLIYALYVGLSVSISIHWFSEFVAGALIGTAIGLAVGRRNFPRLTTTI